MVMVGEWVGEGGRLEWPRVARVVGSGRRRRKVGLCLLPCAGQQREIGHGVRWRQWR